MMHTMSHDWMMTHERDTSYKLPSLLPLYPKKKKKKHGRRKFFFFKYRDIVITTCH